MATDALPEIGLNITIGAISENTLLYGRYLLNIALISLINPQLFNKVTASKKLLDYLLREDVQDLMVKEIGTVPVIESALQNIDENINPLYKGQIAQTPYTSFESLCIDGRGYEIFRDIATAVLTSSLGECDTWLEFLTNQFDLIR